MTISQSHFATQERRMHIARAYLQKKMQSEIAREVGVTQQQVSYDLKAIQTAWRQSSVRDFDAAKAEALESVDLLERESWQAWERSKLPREVTVTEATDGGSRKATRRQEGQVGDPRFLERIDKCIERRCAILGLNAPQKIAPTSPDGTKPYEPLGPPSDQFFTDLSALFAQYGAEHRYDHSYDSNAEPN